MARYKVKRTFPSRETLVRGGIIEDPAFSNIGQLVRTGYLELVPDEVAPEQKIDEVVIDPAKTIESPIAAPPVIEETKVAEKTIEQVDEVKSASKPAPKSKAKQPAAKK